MNNINTQKIIWKISDVVLVLLLFLLTNLINGAGNTVFLNILLYSAYCLNLGLVVYIVKIKNKTSLSTFGFNKPHVIFILFGSLGAYAFQIFLGPLMLSDKVKERLQIIQSPYK